MASLMELLDQESAPKRLNLTARPIPAGNPVMEQMGGGFQISPEEAAFEPKASRGQAFGTAAISALLGGARQAIPAYQGSIGRQEAGQIQEALQGPYQRFIAKEGRTRQDFNELAAYRAQLTGEQPRLYAPPKPMISRRTIHTRNDSGVMMSQDQRVRINPETGEVLEATDIGDSYRKNALRRRASITLDQEVKYNRKQDYRDMISAGGWQEEVLAMIREIDPDKKIDVNDKNAAMLLFGSKARDHLPDFRVDHLEKIATALDSTAGDIEFGTEKWRKGAKRAFVKELMGLWDQHKYGDPEQGVTTGEGMTGQEFDARLKGLGAGTAGATTQDPSLLSQARTAFGGGGDPYARQPASIGPPTNVLRSARTPTAPGYRPEQFAGAGVSGIAPPMTTRSSPPAEGAATGYAGLGPMTPGQQPWEKGPSTMDRLQGGLDEVATSFAEWQGPQRAGAALQRELQGPRPTDFNLSGLYESQPKVPWQQRLRNVSEGRPSGIQSPVQMLDEALEAVADDLATRGTKSANEAYRRAVKKFKGGDKKPRELSALERSLAAIVNGESAVR